MKTKPITITMDEDVIEAARRDAERENISLSAFVTRATRRAHLAAAAAAYAKVLDARGREQVTEDAARGLDSAARIDAWASTHGLR